MDRWRDKCLLYLASAKVNSSTWTHICNEQREMILVMTMSLTMTPMHRIIIIISAVTHPAAHVSFACHSGES